MPTLNMRISAVLFFYMRCIVNAAGGGLLTVTELGGRRYVSSFRRGPMIIAHRGASYDAPENTLAAIRLAWEQDADAVEIDVRMTSDGRIVLMHDKDAARTGRRRKRIADMAFSEVRSLDAGAWKGKSWAGEQVPEFGEVLSVVPENRKIFVEVKCGPEIVGPLCEALSKADFSGDGVAVISFQTEVLTEVRRTLPELPVYLLVEHKRAWPSLRWNPTPDDMFRMAHDIGVTGLNVRDRQFVDRTFVARLHEEGLRCLLWTVDNPERARQLHEVGVDAITTNRPALIRQACSVEP